MQAALMIGRLDTRETPRSVILAALRGAISSAQGWKEIPPGEEKVVFFSVFVLFLLHLESQ